MPNFLEAKNSSGQQEDERLRRRLNRSEAAECVQLISFYAFN